MDRFQPAVRPTTGSHRVAGPIKTPSPEFAMKATTLSSFRRARRARRARRLLALLAGLALAQAASAQQTLSLNLSRPHAEDLHEISGNEPAWGLDSTSIWYNERRFTSGSLNLQGSGVELTTSSGLSGSDSPSPDDTGWRMFRYKTFGSWTVTLSNLNQYFPNGCFIYGYVAGSTNRQLNVYASYGGTTTGTIYTKTATIASADDYRRITSTDPDNPTPGGNYFQYGEAGAGLTADTVTLHMSTDSAAGLGALQIVAATPPASAAPPVITRAGFNGPGDFEVEAGNLQSGTTYTLQRAADLSAEASFDHEADSATPAGETHTFTDEDPPMGKAFYRVEELMMSMPEIPGGMVESTAP